MTPTNITRSVLEAINKRWPSPRECHVCRKAGPWDAVMVGEVRQYCDGVSVGGAPIAPLVVLTCSHCGNTVLFNAIKLGLVDQETARLK